LTPPLSIQTGFSLVFTRAEEGDPLGFRGLKKLEKIG
jgi:hypothetical protein